MGNNPSNIRALHTQTLWLLPTHTTNTDIVTYYLKSKSGQRQCDSFLCALDITSLLWGSVLDQIIIYLSITLSNKIVDASGWTIPPFKFKITWDYILVSPFYYFFRRSDYKCKIKSPGNLAVLADHPLTHNVRAA